MISNTKWKDCKSRKKLRTKNFRYTKKFYLHEITAVDLSKIYFLKNAKKACKPNNGDWTNLDESSKKNYAEIIKKKLGFYDDSRGYRT